MNIHPVRLEAAALALFHDEWGNPDIEMTSREEREHWREKARVALEAAAAAVIPPESQTDGT